MQYLPVNIYLGRFGEEQLLCEADYDISPDKDGLIFYDGELYKVMYTMLDIDNNAYNVFVRLATEEDY